jgi:hypothetical protein
MQALDPFAEVIAGFHRDRLAGLELRNVRIGLGEVGVHIVVVDNEAFRRQVLVRRRDVHTI